MSYFKHHVFICVNERPGGESCCQALGAAELYAYAKERLKTLKLSGPGKVRLSQSGCLGRCDLGPTLVVYPQGIWYQCRQPEDIDRIIDEHLIGARLVEDLQR